MTRTLHIVSLAFATLVTLFAPTTAQALDAPHNNATNSTVFPITSTDGECEACHLLHGGAGSDYLIDFALVNDLCLTCHLTVAAADGTGNSDYLVVDSHFGARHTAANECTDCHNPHQHETSYTSTTGCGSGGTGCFLKDTINGVTHSTTSTTTLSTGTGANTGICEVCHTATTYHTGDVDDGVTHNDGAACTECHAHYDATGSYGFTPAGGSCQACHSGTKNTRRPVVNDISSADSHHLGRNVGSTPVNQFDCVICHLEGNSNGSRNSTYHNDGTSACSSAGVVNLRDVDGGAGWTYDDCSTSVDTNPVSSGAASCTATDQKTDMTMFCLTCHDSDGIADTTFIGEVNTADADIVRSAKDPFGYGVDRLGSAVESGRRDVMAQFDPSHLSTHSISCWLDSSGAGCNSCPAGEHPDQFSNGACVPDTTCSPATGQLCEVRGSEAVYYCELGTWGSTNCNPTAGCATGYELVAGECQPIQDCTAAGVGTCAGGFGDCVDLSGGGSPTVETITSSQGTSTGSTGALGEPDFTSENWAVSGTWSYLSDGGGGATLSNANMGDARVANANATATFQWRPQTTTTETFHFWVAAGARLLSSGGGATAMTLSLYINGGGGDYLLGSVSSSSAGSFAWNEMANTYDMNSGTNYTLKLVCAVGNRRGCAFDGLIFTTETITPTTDVWGSPGSDVDWDQESASAGMDVYTPGSTGGGPYECQCGTGVAGTRCEQCDTGYVLQGGDCVLTSSSYCNGLTCGGVGTCYIYTDPADYSTTFPYCDCSNTWYDSATNSYTEGSSGFDACNTCADLSTGGTWTSGYHLPYTKTGTGSEPTNGYIQCGAFTGTCSNASQYLTATSGWDYDNTTECRDCHGPANTDSSGNFYGDDMHASQRTNFMLDLKDGTDSAAVVDTTGLSTATNIVCMKCHSISSYVASITYTRMPRHKEREVKPDNRLGCIPGSAGLGNCSSAPSPGTEGTGAGCFNCHAGAAFGQIHGETSTMTDADNTGLTFDSNAFLTGGVFDEFYEASPGVGGTSVGCSPKNTGYNSWNLGCSSHGGGASYTKAY